MDKPSFVYVTYIKSTRERVWQALTDGAVTQAYWFGYRIESDWKVGGPLRFYDPSGKLAHDDRVLEAEPPARLAYSWRPLMKGFDKEPASRLTMTLEEVGALVKLTVEHDEFEPGSAVLPAVSRGWPAVLSSLKSLLETGEALKMTPPEKPAD